MANVKWEIRLYDLDGNGVTAADMTPSATVSNEIKHATNRRLNLHLNGVDSLDLTLYLDDPMALQISRLKNTIKVWRTVYNDSGAVIYSDAADNPIFAGIVAGTHKSGDANTMDINVQSPLWRLQSRFHTHNHYLKTNIDTGQDYLMSEMLWKLIDLINNAFNLTNSNTGIIKGLFSTGNDPVVAPLFVPRGSNTWINFDELMSRKAGVDIVPEYYHVTGNPTLMVFNTEEKRGVDISSTIKLNYHTGTNDNLDDFSESVQIVPGEFANYMWAVGHGGPNSGKIAVAANIDEDDDAYTNIGIYMRRGDYPEVKRIGVAGPPPTGLRSIIQPEFAQSRVPRKEYTGFVSPAGGIYYSSHFSLGDVVEVNASKGALQVSAVKQRIYDPVLTISDNNVEVCTLEMSNDFTGKVAV